MFKKTDIAKLAFAILMSFIIALSRAESSKAAGISMPILPYIPPESAQIMDLISNAYGVTAPMIDDAEEKMDAYLKIYQGILGASYDTFKAKLDEIIDGAKTSGKIVIEHNASSIIQNALSDALQNGYDVETGVQGIDNVSDAYDWIVARYPDTVTYSYFKLGDLQNDLIANGGNTDADCHIYIVLETGFVNVFVAPTTTTLYNSGKTVQGNVNRIRVRTVSTTTRYYNNGNNINLPFTWNNMTDFINLANLGIEKKNVSAQSTSISTAITQGNVIPVTADTDAQDMTGDIVINIPSITIYPAETVNDLQNVQDGLGVMPTTPDTTAEQLQQIIETLKATQTEKYGDVGEYSINLTEYFPFCIPFDIGNILTMFVAEPQAPVVTFQLPIGYDAEEGIIFDEFTLDLSQFDAVALWCRRGMLLVFIVGLGMITRQVFLRG